MPDGGEKYLRSIYSDDWLRANGIVLNKENENQIFSITIAEKCDYKAMAEALRKEIDHNGAALVL